MGAGRKGQVNHPAAAVAQPGMLSRASQGAERPPNVHMAIFMRHTTNPSLVGAEGALLYPDMATEDANRVHQRAGPAAGGWVCEWVCRQASKGCWELSRHRLRLPFIFLLRHLGHGPPHNATANAPPRKAAPRPLPSIYPTALRDPPPTGLLSHLPASRWPLTA
jgi:hypothetical protein